LSIIAAGRDLLLSTDAEHDPGLYLREWTSRWLQRT
jgi:hypothetical protein